MKKIKKIVSLLAFIAFIITSVFVFSNPVLSKSKVDNTSSKYILRGLIVSGIPSSDLISKTNGPVFVGLEKVDNAYDLRYSESFDSSNSIPLFSRVNLFSTEFTNKNALTVEALQKIYKNLPEGDDFDREKIIATVNSLYIDRYGNPLVALKKVDSEIQITYKKISTGRGSSLIPIRNVKKSDKVKTFFLLDPYAIPRNERLNKFDFEYAYDINPVFFNTIALREKSESSRTDFSGFYIDIPDTTNEKFTKVMENSLKHFYKFVHSKKKILIVENLTENNYQLGRYADIVGIQYDGNLQFLESVRREFPDKVVFALINSDFSQSNVKNILQNLSLFGIYPEFGKDSKTGDFLYYEPQFQKDLSIINSYIKGIIAENGLTFKRFYTKDGFKISEFSNGRALMYFIEGKGICTLHPDVSGITQYYDLISGKRFVLQTGKISVPVSSGTFVTGYKPGSPIQFLGILPESQSGVVNVLFQNFANKKQLANIAITTNGKTALKESENYFLPEAQRVLSIRFKSGVLKIFVNGNDVFTIKVRQNFNTSPYLFLILLLALAILYLYSGKITRYIKRGISVKAFLLLIFVGGFSLIILNAYLIHYSQRVFLFLLFGIYFIFLGLYDYAFIKNSLRWSTVFFAFGFAVNFLEYKTLMPKFFYGIMPYQRFDWVLFVAPWVLLLAAFAVYGNKRFIKSEVILLILSLAGPVFFFTPKINPMVLKLTLANSYPLAIVTIGGGVLAALHKKNFAPYLALLFVITGLYFGSVYASNAFYSQYVFSHSSLVKSVILKDFFMFISPFYFIALLHHNIVKTNPKVSINKFVITFLFIVILAALYSMWGFNVHCSTTIERIFAMPTYILIEFLLSMILIQPLNKHTEV